MKNETFESLFKVARERGVPIVVVRTADQFATTSVVQQACTGFAVVQWDAARGLTPMSVVDAAGKVSNEPKSEEALSGLRVNGSKVTQDATVAFNDAMTAVQTMPRASVVVVHNAQRQVQSSEPYAVAQSVQAIINLRDLYKKDFRMLVLLAPTFVVPPEMEHDVVVLDHALPGPEVLATLVKELHVSAKLDAPSEAQVAKAVEAVRGLSEFAAEQVVAMSLVQKTDTQPGGLDLDALWERKRVTIEQTRGLRVWRGGERFDNLIGLDNVKANLRQQLTARTPVGVVVFIDEIDKVFANVEHDTSNVKMDQLRALLTEMENNEWTGCVCVGVAGGGKSAIAKSFGNEAGVPTIALDLGDMEGPHVGESEAMLRHAIAVIKAVGSGNAFLIATSNQASVMRPELQRRFTEGVFFFDLMTEEERTAAWKFYVKKYDLPDKNIPNDDGWTGAEIRNCCRRAWNSRISLVDAGKFVVPMARSRADEIERLRKAAHETMLDATKPGMYRYEPEPMAKTLRAIALPDGLVPALDRMKES